MNLKADGLERPGWALRDCATQTISAATCVESHREASDLLEAQAVHQPHRGKFEVVPVVVTVRIAGEDA